ncbi:fimbrial-like protein [Salmonella enterica]|uniref:Fimbrial protein n=1 Tax=Salmonella enterica I TaxID=59201 RepID=A0A3U9L8N4_SALET|nr:fimbrial-like protein [Salmonella enterica]AZT34375.1 fimbrial protein [Salmonella enterica subsp. enterica serovar Stanleyville]EAA6144038.1 fimbrial protein [Salmonella enterica subsp. enterica serovar Eboko]EAB9004891.1 fimbrial protein [Salmonella enterica subsp. enterica serovar Ajiobo]EAC1005499.1 fimbrial protein [Salmonella enterica subsp. enterica]ECY4209078.1 fimbrial protein [Salmonella enterica subsp. enterica serovar Typhimurium]EIL1352110.1 fimbrial protein [Salmonella enteri
MRYLLFSVRPATLALLMGLAAGQWPAVSYADDGLDVNFSARIVNNTCQISLANGGDITLPTVMQSWFYNSDGSDRLQATTDAGGTPFTIQVVQCDAVSSSGNSLQSLHFQFAPQSSTTSGDWQVFINEAGNEAATNVGVVIFSETYRANVLNGDGSSDVEYDVRGKSTSDYLTDYAFYARYQNTGKVSSGKVLSNVVVSVTYE